MSKELTKTLVLRIRQIFEEKMKAKTGWGKNEIMIEYDKAVTEALVEAILK